MKFTPQDEADFRDIQQTCRAHDSTLSKVAECVTAARDRQLFRIKYETWTEFVDKCLPISQSTFYRMARLMPGAGEGAPIPDRHQRELEKIPEPDRAKAYSRAKRRSKSKQPKLRDVTREVDAVLKGEPAEEPQPDIATDGRGEPVKDERFAPIFAAVSTFNAADRLVNEIGKVLWPLLDEDSGILLSEQRQAIDRDRRNIKQAIRFSKPYAICPYCGGSGKCAPVAPGDKTPCRGLGWVNEEIWNQSPSGKKG